MNGQLYFSLSGHITGASGSLFLICSSGKGTSEPIWTQWVQPTRKLLFSRLSPYSYFPPGQKYLIENKKVFPTFLRRTELNALTMRTLAAPVMKVTIEERKKHHHFLSCRHLVSNAWTILISWVLINHNSEHIRYSDFSTPSSLVAVSLNWRKTVRR